jgi:hypothetical protein
MKASELIARLQSLLAEHGDLYMGKLTDEGDYDTVDYVEPVTPRGTDYCHSNDLKPKFFRAG